MLIVGLAAWSLLWADPPPAAPTPARALAVTYTPLPIDVSALKSRLREVGREVRVEEDGHLVVYRGIPLAEVLREHVVEGGGRMKSLRALAGATLLISARDGYTVSVSAAAAAIDTKGERYLLAFERDGKPLDDKHGPTQLVVPAEPEHVRWIWQIDAIGLIQTRSSEAPAEPKKSR